MREAFAALLAALRNGVVRAKHVLAFYSPTGGRTLVQVKGFAGEVFQGIELLLPYGYSAMPVGQTADLVIFQVNGNRDHKVALGADDPACRIAGLVPGEFGLQDNQGQQVVFKRTGIVVYTPLNATVTAGGTAIVSGATVKVHASTVYEWDVNGYGYKYTWTGSNNFTIDEYVEGAIVATNTHTYDPPGPP